MTKLIQQARDSDPGAVEAVTNVLRPRITRMAAYYARWSGEDPDDLLQEAWIGLLDALAEVDLRIGSPEQYLIARARWRILDTIKRSRIRRCEPLEEDSLVGSTTPALEYVISSVHVSEFVSRLKANQRRVLRCLLAGLTWREAGDELGCASANIAYHVRQIRLRYEQWVNE